MYALDCEMVYTCWGPCVARVSVVDVNSQPVFESLIRPSASLIDCNSRFSGLRPEMFAEHDRQSSDSLKDLRQVHSDLLQLFSAETILIGHSLESDLRALRMVHGSVVDTSVVFPHRLGLPYKRALKTLAAEMLKKIIQEDGGSFGTETVLVCLCLCGIMSWKKSDLVN